MRSSHCFEGDAAVHALHFLPDGSFLVEFENHRIQRWTTSPLEAVATLEGCGGRWAWHPDGDLLVAEHRGALVRLRPEALGP